MDTVRGLSNVQTVHLLCKRTGGKGNYRQSYNINTQINVLFLFYMYKCIFINRYNL